MAKPKAVLFDVGGVCVVSPFQAIVDYESQYGIPKDYINFSISRSAPNGAWQRLERGEIKMDEAFFAAFQQDLNNSERWEQYHAFSKNRAHKKSLKELAGAKATQLGDPISLKAETSNTIPTPDEAGAPPAAKPKRRSFKEVANRTMLGDPVSLKAEKTDESPLPDDSGAPSEKSPAPSTSGSSSSNSLKESYSRNMLGDPTSLQNEKVETGPTESSQQVPKLPSKKASEILGDPTSLKSEGISGDPLPDQQDTGLSKNESKSSGIPPMPKIDSTKLFWNMMARIREPDPNIFPALLALRDSKQFLVAALSNTVVFPADHELSKNGSRDIQSHFDVFVSSSEIGLRKPDPKIYKLAVEKLDKFDKGRGGDGVRPDQVVFLDDIGENLKPARDMGMQTIKVNLGRTNEAVDQLEDMIGLKLTGSAKSRL